MRVLLKYFSKVAIVVLIGGFAGSTLVRFAPGYGTTEEELDTRLNADSVQALRRAHTVQGSLTMFYVRYWRNLLQGDFGYSSELGAPVRQLIAERFPETLKTVGGGLVVGWGLGLGLAILSTTARSAVLDLCAALLATIVLCTPAAALALLCVMVRAPGRLVIAAVIFPKVFQFARNILLRSAFLPYILTANAKGLSKPRVFFWHILPVAAPQLLALAAVTVSMAFTAAIPVEALCDIPGIGQLAWQAALARDLQVLVILTMIVTAVTLLANSGGEILGDAIAGR